MIILISNIVEKLLRYEKKYFSYFVLILSKIYKGVEWFNMVNYSLLDVPESECDSLGINGVTSIADLPVNMDWNIYPNPTSDYVEVSFPNSILGSYKVSSISGGVLMESTFENTFVLKINTSSLSNGIYFLEVKDSTGTKYTSKFVINK